jgi:Holliday junction resolvase RusA-like endonuclease
VRIECDLPMPPSVNDIWTPVAMPRANRRAARLIKSKLYTEWEAPALRIAKSRLLRSDFENLDADTRSVSGVGFGSSRLRMWLVYHFVGNRNDDINNREKALSDMLEDAGWFDNDYQIDETHIYRGDTHPTDPHVNVIMEVIE